MKVTRELVEQAFRLSGTQVEIAKQLGLSQLTTRAIFRGEYQHLLDGNPKLNGRCKCPRCNAHVLGQCPLHPDVEMEPEVKYAPQLSNPYGAAFGRVVMGFCGRVIRKKVSV